MSARSNRTGAAPGAPVARGALPRPWTRALGRCAIEVSALTCGTSRFGSTVSPADAKATLGAVWDSPIRCIDTANEYSNGESERIIGEVLRERDRPGAPVVLTKVDRDASGSFSASRVHASYRESLERLGVESVPVLFLHDPHKMALAPGQSVFDAVTAPGGPLEALLALKAEGAVGAVGLAGGTSPLMESLAELDVFDAFLTHNRWTLVDRSAGRLLELAEASGAGVLNAAVFGGRILAQGRSATTVYAYREANTVVLDAVDAIERHCEARGVPLAAAALQFSLNEPRIHSTVVGVGSAARVHETLRLAELELPSGLLEELESLVPAPEHWVDANDATSR